MHDFFVPGIPRPQGDLLQGRQGRLYMAQGVKSWRRDIGICARAEIGIPIGGPVTIDLAFILSPPAREPTRRGPHSQTPDLDKLVRAVLDGLKGIAYLDDRQVSTIVARKRWGLTPGVLIRVGPWDEIGVTVHDEGVPIGV